ncbi:MAG: hypothetical protein EBW47_03805 [Betaproteobacteria bacterium]|nr:hypothetical protein [Betaproteobacteria bacterium]
MTQQPKALVHCLFLGLRAMFRPAYWWLALWPVGLSIAIVGLLLWWALPALLESIQEGVRFWQAELVPYSQDGYAGSAQPGGDPTDAAKAVVLPSWLWPALLVVIKALGSPAAMSVLGWVLGLLAALPLSWLFVLLISGLIVTPAIRAHLLQSDYPGLAGRSGGSLLGELAQSFWVFARLAAGLLLLLPLWFLAPWFAALALIALMAWSTASVFVIDCLGGLSNAQERKRMMQSERFALLSLGALVSAMGTFPLMWLVAPIFASVVFGHFTLSRLESSAAKLSANDPSGIKSIGINHE